MGAATTAAGRGPDAPTVLVPHGGAAVHVGRQPLFDRDGVVIGHELLFRGTDRSTTAVVPDPDAATTTVILNTFTAFDLDDLVGEGKAFLNLTRAFLVGDLPVPVPPHRVVLEVLETVPVDAEVIAGVRRLRAQGYSFALDDLAPGQEDRLALLDCMDVVKVDLGQVSAEQLPGFVARVREHGVRLVAERVETAEDLRRCTELGFELFQGYHLRRPETVTTRTVNPAREALTRLLAVLGDEDIDLATVETVLRSDPALAYRALRTVNAAALGMPTRLSSVRQAVVLLGVDALRRWVLLLLAQDATALRPDLLTDALVRGRMCELLAPDHGTSASEAFTVGLLSALEAPLGSSGEDLADRLRLTAPLRDALVDGRGPLGGVLRTVLAHQVPRDAVPYAALSTVYLEALVWAGGLTRTLVAAPRRTRSRSATGGTDGAGRLSG